MDTAVHHRILQDPLTCRAKCAETGSGGVDNQRRHVVQGKSIKYLTPDAVVDYIRAHNLYKSS